MAHSNNGVTEADLQDAFSDRRGSGALFSFPIGMSRSVPGTLTDTVE